MTSAQYFNKLFTAIRTFGKLRRSPAGLDAWHSDVWEHQDLQAVLQDGGNTRIIRCVDEAGEIWNVLDLYPRPLSYSGITEAEFNALVEAESDVRSMS
jgi:hypothetical protein